MLMEELNSVLRENAFTHLAQLAVLNTDGAKHSPCTAGSIQH